MRDVFDEIFAQEALGPLDPSEAARRSMRAPWRQRFYKKAGVGQGEGGFQILLDGKPVRTPARRTLAAPTQPLAEAIAAEWEAQTEAIDASKMPLTRLANAIIDGVADAPREVAGEIEKYLGSDLLFYRAGEPQGLVERQARYWDPVLAWAREALGARFVLAEGVVFVAQPEEALAAARSAVPGDPWRLGASHVITTLTGSALLALALAAGKLSLEEAWEAAQVDEDWQMQQWGRDESALERRARRFADMQAAAAALALLN
jgi:chaperone required for assembly of F1-ATPase